MEKCLVVLGKLHGFEILVAVVDKTVKGIEEDTEEDTEDNLEGDRPEEDSLDTHVQTLASAMRLHHQKRVDVQPA